MAWTEKGLFSRICSFENLLLAERKARRGKGTKPAVLAFWLDAERQLPRLRDELLSRTWRPKGYTRFVAHESKGRLISAAPYADRVVHHAVMNVVGPVLERSFIHDSYANRKGKGTHRALLRCSRFCRNARFVLKCDIADYFASVDHGIMMAILERRIADADALRLVEAIVRSGASIVSGAAAAGAWPASLATGGGGKGLPVGNLTSQCLANAYLDGFDHFVKEDLRARRYLRYVDDFAVFGDDPARLEGIREGMAGYLRDRLNLRLHPRKTRIFPVEEGVDFLGFRVFPGHRLLRKTAGYHYQRMLFKLARERREGMVSPGAIRNSFASWSAHAAWGATAGLKRRLLAEADARGAGLQGGRGEGTQTTF